MYPRNAASPERIAVGAVVQISDGAVQSSGVSIKVKPQGAAASAGGGTTSYEEGMVGYVPTQAETDYTSFQVIAYKTGCIPVAVTVVTSASATAGYAGTDQGKIANATSTVNLSGTTIKTATDVETDSADIQSRLPAALTADGNIKADTLRVGGTLQTAGDLVAMLTVIDDFLDTEIAAILADTGTDIPALIAALNNLSAAQVNAEVVDALNVDTYAQPGQGAPAATTTMRLMLAYLYKWARNKRDNDGSVNQFYNDDASTVDQKQTTVSSGGTVTVGEMATGP